jgi:hypothetical protein
MKNNRNFKFFLVLIFVLIGFMLIGCRPVSKPEEGSLVSAINQITNDTQKRAELLVFVKGLLEHGGVPFYEELPFERHGVDYSYDINGKYLFVYERMYGGAGSSYGYTKSYIIDTELKVLIQTGSLFADLSDPLLKKLIIEYLSREDDFDMINQEYLSESIIGIGFSLFYTGNGVGMLWGRGIISANAWSYRINIPCSSMYNFLTPLGRDIFSQ